MKTLLIVISALITSTAYANENLACSQSAQDSVVGFVKGLGQDVSVANIKLINSFADGNTANETYEVKLKGNGFSSPETNGVWTIKLNDLGDGCSFSSLSLGDATSKSEPVENEYVEFSHKSELLKLMQAINKVNNGSNNGNSTGSARIECVMSQTDRYCAISKLVNN